MSIYHKIVKNVLHLDNNIFSNTYQSNDKINNIHKAFLSNLCSEHYLKYYKNKFIYVNVFLHNFHFSKFPHLKTEYLNLFYTIQKYFHILNRFVYSYKYKKSKILIKSDLQLNEIKPNDDNVICIYHINSRYLFKIEELLKIIYVSLTNTSSFFSEPITIKNPYNNIPFNKSILFHIYIFLMNKAKIRFIKTEYLEVFFQFKKFNFNLTNFMDHNEISIRNYAIRDYLKNSKTDILCDFINDIILNYNRGLPKNQQILISNDFPKTKLVEVFKPFIRLKLLSKYSLNPKIKMDAKYFIEYKLNEFQSYNPKFGRKYIKYKIITNEVNCEQYNFNQKRKIYIKFDSKHKAFYTGKINEFMKNHINYKYNYYEGIIDDIIENNINENNEIYENHIISDNNDSDSDGDTETIISYNEYNNNDTIIENISQISQSNEPILNSFLHNLRQGNSRSIEIANIIERTSANVFQPTVENNHNNNDVEEHNIDDNTTDDVDDDNTIDDVDDDNTTDDVDDDNTIDDDDINNYTDTDTDNNVHIDDNESIS
jgi:hypothetical protein